MIPITDDLKYLMEHRLLGKVLCDTETVLFRCISIKCATDLHNDT